MIQPRHIKHKILAGLALIASVFAFGVYSLMYTNIFQDNLLLGRVPSAKQVKISDINSNSNILGESKTSELDSTDPTELRAKAASLAAQKKVLGSKSSFGIAVADYTNKSKELDSLNNLLNKKVSTVSIFKQFGNPYNDNLSGGDLTYIKANNLKLQIAWEPWNPDEGLNQSTDYLGEIPSGVHDEYIKSFAKSVANLKSPVVIRFGHEMNGNWYPWGNRGQEYISAYRHIVNVFKAEGVKNVDWMWCINAQSVPQEAIALSAKFYPGSDFVDVLGIDGVNFGSSKPDTSWQTFSQIFSPAYAFLTKTYSQPIIIAETASSELGGDKAVWIDQMFSSLPKSFPKVTDIIWFSINKETDWRINSTDSALESFKKYL